MSDPQQAPLRHGLKRQFSRFVGVGVVNSVATFVLYQMLLLAMPYWLAFTLSFAAGLVFGMIAGARLVFGRKINLVSAASFSAYYVFSYALSLLILMVVVDRLQISARLAPLIVIAIMVPLNFLGSRYALSLRSQPRDAGER
ncbi:MAG TPA: GtrA family protein [Rhodopseudomonas sp.]|uniref:GtrA family protein n=1 Tax=Rhodopseudomonas sp. TaxID=1078 RepID=UPI002ED7E6C3